jgi:hypothetical protein
MSGNGEFYGEKYDQLLVAKPYIESAGFGVPEMYGLPQSILDKVLFASSLPSIAEADRSEFGIHDVQKQIVLPPDLLDHVVEVSRGLAGVFAGPLVMRSSGNGDAIGVGVYSSSVFSDNARSARDAFAKVVASYFSNEAIIYRQRAEIESGFAMFMQPLVGTAQEGVSEYRPSETAQIFDTLLSGNARIGTPRSPRGSMKLQPGHGCAVAIPGLPAFDFADTWLDDGSAERSSAEVIVNNTGHRYTVANSAETNIMYVKKAESGWKEDYGEYSSTNRSSQLESLTIGALKEQLSRIHDVLGNRPAYYEFVVRNGDNGEELYVVQKGDLQVRDASVEITIDNARKEDILLNNMVVEAGNGYSPVFKTIVCFEGESNFDLYAFDETEAAQNGYLLALRAEKIDKVNPINVRRLKNARAIVTIESKGRSHTTRPEEHVAGYSEALGIPFISVFDSGSRAWRLFNGSSLRRDRTQKGRREGSLLVRDGSFMVVSDPYSKDGLILEFGREK